MAMTESERRDLYTGLERSIGSKDANNLMRLLPNEPAANLATRDDIHANTTMLRGEMAELRGELLGEMATLRAELRGEMVELRAELRGELASLRAGLTGAMAELKASTQRMFAGALAANSVAVIAALVA